jgi:hypothetical protein
VLSAARDESQSLSDPCKTGVSACADDAAREAATDAAEPSAAIAQNHEKSPATATITATKTDPRLQAIVEAWDRLPEHVRATIAGLTHLAGKGDA